MKRAYQIVSACFIAFHLCGCKNANQAQYAPQKSLAGSQNNHTDRGSAPNQKAIEAVASQFNRATMVFSNSVATLKQHPIKALFSNGLHNSFQNYKTALEQIDTQGCPVDLRITFVKYSQAVQHIIQFDNECSGLFGIGE